MAFQDDFLWAAAAASYQVEGAWNEDGKGKNVWDMFSRIEGKTHGGQRGDVACDHYHRFQEDVEIMKEIGLKAYRLSISWARVLPEGTGRRNEKGLSFYDRLIDALLAADIVPLVTLFHWDYPYTLYKQGGWLNPESPDWFADYTRLVTDRLSDRVDHWMTINEPAVFTVVGHQVGAHAPGLKLGLEDIGVIWRNVLLSHGKSVQTIREHARKRPNIGWAPNVRICTPATRSQDDIAYAQAMMEEPDGLSLWENCWWLDPVYKGELNDDAARLVQGVFPTLSPADLDVIHQELDFFGMNNYQSAPVFVDPKGGSAGRIDRTLEDGYPVTAMDWPVTPENMYWGPKYFHDRYGLPILVTENGMANLDWVALDGAVHDPQRIDFLARSLGYLKKAAQEGVDVKGYCQWSIMDNYEWAYGYSRRFGMVFVDFANGNRRIAKDSGRWYAGVIRSNGENLAIPE